MNQNVYYYIDIYIYTQVYTYFQNVHLKSKTKTITNTSCSSTVFWRTLWNFQCIIVERYASYILHLYNTFELCGQMLPPRWRHCLPNEHTDRFTGKHVYSNTYDKVCARADTLNRTSSLKRTTITHHQSNWLVAQWFISK